MKKIAKLAALAAAAVLAVQAPVFADFSDMPEGEIGAALQKAVDNGLISGYDDGTVRPDDNIKRAEMAAIIVRAMGASEKSSKTFPDVASDAWYADSVSKAVQMGAFAGDTAGNLNPENNITCQETYTVLSRVFQFIGYPRNFTDGTSDVMGQSDPAVLNTFTDKDSVASWATDYAAAIVQKGGFTGFNGLLKGNANITRGEFAYLMDELIGTYIDQPGEYAAGTIDGSKSVVVRSGGVTIDGFTTDRNLIVAYSADTKGVKVTNSTVNGVTAIMGCADTTAVGTKSTENLSSYISISGTFYDVRICAPYIFLDASGASMKALNGGDYTKVNMGMFGS
ncbi:MAG: S-layer homology domain-containing protein [bacterium]|nr:S-layer homology domain-containing protein [bacterium]